MYTYIYLYIKYLSKAENKTSETGKNAVTLRQTILLNGLENFFQKFFSLFLNIGRDFLRSFEFLTRKNCLGLVGKIFFFGDSANGGRNLIIYYATKFLIVFKLSFNLNCSSKCRVIINPPLLVIFQRKKNVDQRNLEFWVRKMITLGQFFFFLNFVPVRIEKVGEK